MRNKIKIISKLLGVLALLMLTNCSKDEFINDIQNQKKKYNISFEQFKKETGLTNFQTTIKIKQSTNTSLAKTADGSYELSDFNIETDIIKRLELNAKTTYTFKITPLEIVDEKSIYNLTVNLKNGIWEKSIVEFIPTDENYQMLVNGLTEQIQGRMKLLYQSNAAATNCTTISIVTITCPGGCMTDGSCDAVEGYYCTHCASYQSLTFCTTDDDGNGSAGDGSQPIPTDNSQNNGTGTNPGGGDGTGNGTSPAGAANEEPIGIIPNIEDLSIDTDGDPKTVDDATNIKQLNKLTINKNGQKTIFKEEIDLLKEKLVTKHTEEGMMYGTEYEPLEGECTKNSTEWNSYPMSHFVAIHMHQNTYYVGTILKPTNPVMSDQDVLATLGFYNYTNNINVTSVLVSRQGTFALKINNGHQVNAAIEAINNNPELKKEFEDNYNDKVQKAFEAGDEAGALQEFIKFINTHSVNGQTMGLSMYQAVYDAQGNIINWIKL